MRIVYNIYNIEEMIFFKLAKFWEKLERTASRNSMMEILAEVLREADKEEVDKVCYLSMGRLGPLFSNVEFNLADKLMIKAVAFAFAVEEKKVKRDMKNRGDLGLVVEELAKDFSETNKSYRTHKTNMTVFTVYSELLTIAKEGGTGSQEKKLSGIAELLRKLDPVSAKYLVRIPIRKMRLGFSDKTILDALSFMVRGDKSGKIELERAYKVRPDIGILARVVKEKGIKGVQKLFEPELGVPILMAKAQRMSSAEEILLKIGECAVEPKIDGFRLQAHMKKSKVNLFTRNLDNVTYMYPDIVEAIEREVKAKSAIFEGEAVAFNPQTNEYLPFQETVQRKRKYDIEKYIINVPLKLIAFDLLYLNGKSLLSEPYEERRRRLEKIICEPKGSPVIQNSLIVAEEHVVFKEKELERLFDEAVSRGLEGVMAKRLDAPYQAGARNWNWIKYKRSYSAKLSDTIDCLVIGYDFGQGKRTQFGVGAFLVGIYDEKTDVFRTVSKVGTGLSDKQWRELKVKSQRLKVANKPKEYKIIKEVGVDVWLRPQMVVEIEADEITKSPVHTAGLALRFPRLKRFRDDKRPQQATTLSELKQMYKSQRKHKVK